MANKANKYDTFKKKLNVGKNKIKRWHRPLAGLD